MTELSGSAKQGKGVRVLAGIGGIIALAIAAIPTLGGALIAPLGMYVSGRIVRRRGGVPTRFTSWLGASTAVAIAFILGTVFLLARMPEGTMAAAQRSADSAVAAQQEQSPSWLDRVAASRRATQPKLGPGTTKVLVAYGATLGAAIAASLFGVFVGTLGWFATLPLAFALTGRWYARRGAGSAATALDDDPDYGAAGERTLRR